MLYEPVLKVLLPGCMWEAMWRPFSTGCAKGEGFSPGCVASVAKSVLIGVTNRCYFPVFHLWYLRNFVKKHACTALLKCKTHMYLTISNILSIHMYLRSALLEQDFNTKSF
jgi:hypothetical protein